MAPSQQGIVVPPEFLSELSSDEKMGWYSKSFHSCMEDKHLVMLCKHLYEKYKVNGGRWEDAPAGITKAFNSQSCNGQDTNYFAGPMNEQVCCRP